MPRYPLPLGGRRRAKLFFLALCCGLLLSVPQNLSAAEDSVLVDVILAKAQSLPDIEPLWELGWRLSHRASVESLKEAYGEPQPPASALVLGYALLRKGEDLTGTKQLEELILNGNAPLSRRIDAAAALGTEGEDHAAARVSTLMQNRELPAPLQVEIAKSLWRLTRGESARKLLQEMVASEARWDPEALEDVLDSEGYKTARSRLQEMLDSESYLARSEAALALASFVPDREAVELIQQLVFEPGAHGREARHQLAQRARRALTDESFNEVAPLLQRIAEYPNLDMGAAQTLLSVANLEGVDDEASGERYAAELLAEIVRKVHRYYPPDLSGSEAEQKRELKRLEPKNLATLAAKTFVSQVDPFSDYLDEADLTEMEEQMSGEYGGIGAWVGMRRIFGENRFTILVPMYDQPAHQAGLKAMDWVEKIDGKPIDDLTLNEIIKRLKGKPNTKVELLVHRRTWRDPRTVTVTRRIIHVPTVRGRMLPGKIGYIRLERFGDLQLTPMELRGKIKELRDDGMEAMVLDLSNNPGGFLRTAVAVADLFLEEDQLVVYTMGRPDSGLRVHEREPFSAQAPMFMGLPMAVLVNGGSASASEIVAGALRDHDRAVLVGQKTFGKGSVQSMFDVRSSGPDTRLKLTVAKYYLPDGDCIHGKGIAPDIEVEEREIEDEDWEALQAIRERMLVVLHIRKTYPEHTERYWDLLTFDNEDLHAYPEIDGLLETLHTEDIEVDPQVLRREIRRELVTYLESEEGEDVIVDPQEDAALQRAIVELQKQMPPLENPPELYAWFEKKIAERAEANEGRQTQAKDPAPYGED
jgi:carboxyl-terminal processing protease